MPLISRLPLWPPDTTVTITVHLDSFQISEAVWVTITDRADGSEMLCEQLEDGHGRTAQSPDLWTMIREAVSAAYMVDA